MVDTGISESTARAAPPYRFVIYALVVLMNFTLGVSFLAPASLLPLITDEYNLSHSGGAFVVTSITLSVHGWQPSCRHHSLTVEHSRSLRHRLGAHGLRGAHAIRRRFLGAHRSAPRAGTRRIRAHAAYRRHHHAMGAGARGAHRQCQYHLPH